MALGGGTWLSQNKVLPGSYINFVSAARATAALSERGIAAMPLEWSWGPEGEVFTVTAQDFQKDSVRLFGYPYTHEKMTGLRDLFQNIRMAHLYRLGQGGKAAKNDLAEARYPGSRGNELKLVISENRKSEADAPLYDVATWLEGQRVDLQTEIDRWEELQDNDYLLFAKDGTLALTAGTPLTGGTDPETAEGDWQTFLDRVEPYSFHTLGCPSGDDGVKGLFAQFTKRMREDCGVKFQCVLFRYLKPDFEGIISVENGLKGSPDSPAAVWWVTGAEAGCAVNRSLTNREYGGDFDLEAGYTQLQLEEGLKQGKFMFHKVGDDIRVLEDVNTFTSFTTEKNEDFSSNQTMRVLDQIGNDIAVLFNTRYLGKVPNNAAGRISLWNDIGKHHQELERIQAIENFDPEQVTVEQGDSKKAVLVTDRVTPVNAMAQLYMTVVVQ